MTDMTTLSVKELSAIEISVAEVTGVGQVSVEVFILISQVNKPICVDRKAPLHPPILPGFTEPLYSID